MKDEERTAGEATISSKILFRAFDYAAWFAGKTTTTNYEILLRFRVLVRDSREYTCANVLNKRLLGKETVIVWKSA